MTSWQSCAVLSEAATLDGMADTLPLPELIAALQRLDRARGVTRAELGRELTAVARASVAAAADQGVWEATREQSAESVASRLGVSEKEIERRITAHRKVATQGQSLRRPRAAAAE